MKGQKDSSKQNKYQRSRNKRDRSLKCQAEKTKFKSSALTNWIQSTVQRTNDLFLKVPSKIWTNLISKRKAWEAQLLKPTARMFAMLELLTTTISTISSYKILPCFRILQKLVPVHLMKESMRWNIQKHPVLCQPKNLFHRCKRTTLCSLNRRQQLQLLKLQLLMDWKDHNHLRTWLRKKN